MQLNGKLIRGVRNIRSFWITTLASIVGVVFIALGIFFFVTDSNKTFETATATIVNIEKESIGEEQYYTVTLSYTDKNGILHSDVTFNGYDSSWKVGKEIEIKYNIDNPDEVVTNNPSFVMPLIAVVLGGIALFVGVFNGIRTVKSMKRKPKKIEEEPESSELSTDRLVDTNLFFHHSGKANQSFLVEDENRQTVYECRLVKFNVLGSDQFEFINSKTGHKSQYKMSKTVTSSSSGGMIFVEDMLSSRFKINGVNCWDYVADMGYEIKHMLLDGKDVMSYQIVRNKKIVAKIMPASVSDPFNVHSKNFFSMNKGYYRLEIADASLSDIVMIAFIISRTDMVE